MLRIIITESFYTLFASLLKEDFKNIRKNGIKTTLSLPFTYNKTCIKDELLSKYTIFKSVFANLCVRVRVCSGMRVRSRVFSVLVRSDILERMTWHSSMVECLKCCQNETREKTSFPLMKGKCSQTTLKNLCSVSS